MREQLLLVSLVVAGAAACAGRPVSTTLNQASMTSQYACDSHVVTREAGKVFASNDTRLALAFQDDAGDHFVTTPESPTAMHAIEYVMPSDARADAIERVYDTSKGNSRADWRVVDENVCVVRGGYTDAFGRFAAGSTMDAIAKDFGLGNRIEARKLIKEGMRATQVRFHREF
ncbi:MAG: hypothetical protein H0V17_06545 [Deltaproteobacteria bacterium]|nr:hypothetical protein [Deltaproteobacteria bacterium]